MKKLGNLYVKTKSKLLVAKSIIDNPKQVIGAEVYDNNMRKIGLVIDVIGQVSNPYVVIKPDSSEVIDYLDIGSVLYYLVRRKRFRKTPRRSSARKR